MPCKYIRKHIYRHQRWRLFIIIIVLIIVEGVKAYW